MFNILNYATKSLVVDADGDLLVFENGNDAKAKCAELEAQTGVRHSPRKAEAVEGDANWKEREAKRFEDGTYTKVAVLVSRNLEIKDHFVHNSKSGDLSIAYTKNDEKGRTDTQTKASLKGYLEAFFANTISMAQMQEIVDEHEISVYKDKLKIAMTPEEIEKVYTSFDPASGVARSCMSSEGARYYSTIHPTRIYGAGDLGIAYTVNDDGKTTNRALVWPERKLYSRVYGTGSMLHTLLKGLGYSKCSYYSDAAGAPSMKGARVLRIDAPNNPGSIVMPYFDEKIGVEESDDPTMLVLTDDDGNANTRETTGISRYHRMVLCDTCAKKTRDGMLVPVTTDLLFNTNLRCNNCCATSGFHCNGFNRYFSNDLTKTVEVHIGVLDGYHGYYTHSDIYVQNNSDRFIYCQRDPSKAMDKGLATTVIVDENGTEQLWCSQSVEGNTYKCEKTEKLYSLSVPRKKVQVGVYEDSKRRKWAVWSMQAVNESASRYKDVKGRTHFICNGFMTFYEPPVAEDVTEDQSDIFDVAA